MNKKTTIGVIYCGFGNIENTKQSIPTWLKAREEKLADVEWIIAGVSVPFKEYKDTVFANDESTTEYLKTLPLDYLVTEPKFVSEAEARNKALFYLLEQGCDFIFLADNDEMFTLDNIRDIAKFIARDNLTTWFSFSYKNYVFDNSHYLLNPFTPPRAFRVNLSDYKLSCFYHDNEVYYTYKITSKYKDFKELSNRIIPQNIAFIKHYTWPNNERGRLKTEYQTTRWGDLCSFKWNYDTNKLEFNENYYKNFNQPLPSVLKD
jgi:hypothetical protein